MSDRDTLERLADQLEEEMGGVLDLLRICSAPGYEGNGDAIVGQQVATLPRLARQVGAIRRGLAC